MNSKVILSGLLAVFLLGSCTTRNAVRIVTSRDPVLAIKSIAQSRVQTYLHDPALVVSDIRQAQVQYNRLLGVLRGESSAKWGKEESENLPTRTRYVKYTENYRNRVIVDFDTGNILIEHLDEENVREKLRSAIVTALLTPGDPRAVDLFSDREIPLNGTPYLQGMVTDQTGQFIEGRTDAEAYASYLVGHDLRTRQINVNGQGKQVDYVEFAMVNTHVERRALKYAPQVRKYAASRQLSRSLVFAVIKTESGFNPFAVSSAPAYGLMQLVPSSGGRDAYRKVKGIDQPPSKEYLFDAENNIELGTTYLNILLNDSQLQDIADPLSREYCAIAAYNTGPSNVLRAFSGNQDAAIRAINSMRPDEVYSTLRRKLPYAETRNYIAKVVSEQKRFSSL